MKITNIKINKFRQLENVVENNIDLINELYGSNGSGKTSFISFITWILYGETLDFGKNDDMNIDTFKPYELIGGEITLNDNGKEILLGREFGYDEKGKKTQNFFVNGRKVKNQGEYYQELNECFNLTQFDKLKITGFNLYRALSDPYYLPNNENQFRDFMSFILNVDTQNILLENEKYIDLKQDYNNQGNYDKCKEFYNQNLKKIDDGILEVNALINECKCENVDEKEIENIKEKLNNLENSKVFSNKELDEKLKELNEIQIQLIESRNYDNNNKPISKEKEEYNELKTKYNNLVEEYEKGRISNKSMQNARIIVNEKIRILESELEELKGKTFAEIKCPNCNTLVNENDYKEFNKNKVESIKKLKKKIEIAKGELDTYVMIDLIELEKTLNDYLMRLNGLKAIIKEQDLIVYVSDKTKALQEKYDNLYNEVDTIRNKHNENVIAKNNEIDNEITILERNLSELTLNQEKLIKLKKHKENKSNLLEKKSIYELRLALLQEFKNDEIKLIKNATQKIFGNEFEFEMLVKNKSNDNYKKVCYASVDGLEHNKSNTAKYLKVSIALLEKIKKFIGGCSIPIIFDIADNIGKSARKDIFNLISESQVFYTRIADDDNVERKLNIIKKENDNK